LYLVQVSFLRMSPLDTSPHDVVHAIGIVALFLNHLVSECLLSRKFFVYFFLMAKIVGQNTMNNLKRERWEIPLYFFWCHPVNCVC